MQTDHAQVAQGQEPKLLDRMRNVLRVKHYSKRTEQAYIAWVTTLVIVDRFFPSSKMCLCCGSINPELTLTD